MNYNIHISFYSAISEVLNKCIQRSSITHNTVYYEGIVSFMGSGVQVSYWPEKWAETSHLCNKLCCT